MNDPSDKLLNTLDMFVGSAITLDRVWQEEGYATDVLSNDYPFPDSFEEVIARMIQWLDTSRGCRADADAFRLAEAGPALVKAAREAHELLSRIQYAYDEADDLIMAPPWPETDSLDLAIKRTER